MNYQAKSKPFKTIGGVVNEIVNQYNWNDAYYLGMIQSEWEHIVGSQVSEKSHIVNLDNKSLLISTESSTWRSELQFRKDSIINEINEMIGKSIIKDIVIK